MVTISKSTLQLAQHSGRNQHVEKRITPNKGSGCSACKYVVDQIARRCYGSHMSNMADKMNKDVNDTHLFLLTGSVLHLEKYFPIHR